MAAVWIANIGRKRAALFHIGSRTLRFLTGRSSLLRTGRLDLLIAPLRVYELSVVAEADVIASKVVPQKAGCGIVYVRHVEIERKLVGHLSLKIVGAFFAAISDLPGFLVVVGSNRRGGPEMAIAGDLPAVVEI